MSEVMNMVSKTWSESGNNYEIKFHYNSDFVSMPAAQYFEIDNVSEIEYGDYDKNELSFFPSNLTITLVSYIAKPYKGLKAALESYNSSFPFNFKARFYTEYFKNGVLKHQGVLASVDYDDETEKVELLISSGTKYYENVNFGTGAYLDRLGQNGLPRHEAMILLSRAGYSYGLDNLGFVPSGSRYKIVPGLVTDTSFHLETFLRLILTSVNADCSVTIDNDFLFGATESGCIASISDLLIRNIHNNYLGRYLVLDKTSPNYGLIDVFDGEWDIVEETDHFKTLLFKEDQSVEDKNLIAVIDNLCYNFFSRMAWKSFDNIVMQKKFSFNPDAAILIEPEDVKENTHTKQTFIPAVKYISIYDAFSDYHGVRGLNDRSLSDEQKLEYSINFSAYADGSITGDSLFYYEGGFERPAIFMKDPVSGYVNRVPETLVELEWKHRRGWRDKIPLTLYGTDWDYSKIYKMRDEQNAMIMLRPMKMTEDEDADETPVEFIDITPS